MSSETNNTTPKYIYIMIVLTLLCIVGAIYKKKRVEKDLRARAYESAQRKIRENKELTPTERISIGVAVPSFLDKKSAKPAFGISQDPNPLLPDPPPSAQERAAFDSAKSVRNFSENAHIAIEPPGSFSFHKLDLDPGFEGIYGEDSSQNAKLTGLAYNQVATEAQVTEFLKTDASSFPNLAQNPIALMGLAEPLPPPPGDSGLAGGKLWAGKLRNGEAVAAVFIERADKKGSYLFVLTGPDAYFRNNDGAFDSVYDKARALDAQGK